MVSHIEDGETFELVKVGVPRDPTEFITAAVTLGHPRFLLARVSGEAEVAVDHLLGNAAELSLYRARFLKRWLQRAKELHKHEEDLHSKLPAHLRRVLASKRLLLLA